VGNCMWGDFISSGTCKLSNGQTGTCGVNYGGYTLKCCPHTVSSGPTCEDSLVQVVCGGGVGFAWAHVDGRPCLFESGPVRGTCASGTCVSDTPKTEETTGQPKTEETTGQPKTDETTGAPTTTSTAAPTTTTGEPKTDPATPTTTVSATLVPTTTAAPVTMAPTTAAPATTSAPTVVAATVKATVTFTGITKADVDSEIARKALTDGMADSLGVPKDTVYIESMTEVSSRRMRRRLAAVTLEIVFAIRIDAKEAASLAVQLNSAEQATKSAR